MASWGYMLNITMVTVVSPPRIGLLTGMIELLTMGDFSARVVIIQLGW